MRVILAASKSFRPRSPLNLREKLLEISRSWDIAQGCNPDDPPITWTALCLENGGYSQYILRAASELGWDIKRYQTDFRTHKRSTATTRRKSTGEAYAAVYAKMITEGKPDMAILFWQAGGHTAGIYDLAKRCAHFAIPSHIIGDGRYAYPPHIVTSRNKALPEQKQA